MDKIETYVIGDVHGCADEFEELIFAIFDEHEKEFDWDTKIRFVLIGDIIDKGPDSIGAVHIAQELRHYGEHECIWLMGNHEEKFLRWLEHQDRVVAFNHNYKNPILKKEEWNIPLVRWGNNFRETLKALPMWYKIPEHNVICVHGGFAPAMQELPTPHRIKDGIHASRFERSILFTRFVNPKGYMVALGSEKEEDNWWADVYDGRFGTAIYGHQAYNEVHFHEHAVGIDTGVCYGNKLSALRVSDMKVIQVAAEKAYCEPFSSEGLK